ncbi:hypothetical protein [uncultured Algibacter sp.]|uniref:hypothetical protein n=1 Tax=uncultured Algibacter sp. TaxID=298659 RepID=UPI002623794A|nr:hypothetical protein [uncultured Algibacter sp.]
MNTLKKISLIALTLCLTSSLALAQQMFRIHQDNVKPSKLMEYEAIAKEFKTAATEHNIDVTWFTAMTNDNKYFYVSPIENFASFDERPFADMAKAMGDDFTDLFARFDRCYDSHGTYVIVKNDELSYMPEGVSNAPADETYREWYYMYYKPEDAKNIKEGMIAVRDMFKEKGSKLYYRVYSDGLGQMEHYYMVSVAFKDEMDAAQRSEENKKVLGPDRMETFNKVMNYVSRMEEHRGSMRPDMDYTPKTE